MFADILLPLPIGSTFTYSVPPDMEPRIVHGSRVVVPFGRRKFLTGIVAGLTPVHPQGFEPKPISQLLDDGKPVIRHPQMKFWEWLADYYLCTPGEVAKAALPAGLRIESETFVELEPDWQADPAQARGLSEREQAVVFALRHADKRLTPGQISKAIGIAGIEAIVARLIERRAVRVAEKLVERYHARRTTFVTPTIQRGDPDAVRRAFATVKAAPRQEKLLLTLLDMSGFARLAQPVEPVAKTSLLERAEVSPAILDALVKRGLAALEQRETSRFDIIDTPTGQLPQLSDPQQQALSQALALWKEKETVLLHGITAAGKTEIYIHLIHRALAQGRQVLYLVPEIALTTQLTRRLQKVFGTAVIVYHSKHGDNERVDTWRAMLNTHKPCVVVGARSSVFLPFASLGLVIIDEEHESSFKQQDPAPRYNARDAALMLARMHAAKALLGSATPAIDTYHKALSGMYGLVSLSTRFDGSPLPSVELIDMTQARQQNSISGTYTLRLRQLIAQTLKAGRQVIVFLNRRGYAPMALCKQCAYVPKCEHCDVALTYHKHLNSLVCHYCGTHYDVPATCPACGQPTIEIVGYGTERIEDDLEMFFPDAKILRLDLDTTRNKDSHQRIINDFSQQKAQILVGTQMVTKGLDFANVGLVAVVNADNLLNMPDFRASERTFNMLEQVAGRAGRRNGNGIVAIQTRRPTHPVFSFLVNHNYTEFFSHELAQRRHFFYPPFTRIINIYIRHTDAQAADRLAQAYAQALHQLFGNRVSGPDTPTISRIQNYHIRRLMLKIETTAPMQRVKEALRTLHTDMHTAGLLTGSALVHYDVDPA